MVLNKTINKAFITHETLKQKPIREIHFHYNLPKLHVYIAFNLLFLFKTEFGWFSFQVQWHPHV